MRGQQVRGARGGRRLIAYLQEQLLGQLRSAPVRPGDVLLSCALRAGSFTSGLAMLVDKIRYILYGKHRRTTFDANVGAHPHMDAVMSYAGELRNSGLCGK